MVWERGGEQPFGYGPPEAQLQSHCGGQKVVAFEKGPCALAAFLWCRQRRKGRLRVAKGLPQWGASSQTPVSAALLPQRLPALYLFILCANCLFICLSVNGH